MAVRFGVSSLIPHGLVVERVEPLDEIIVVTARSDSRSALCPACSATARRVHSRYVRHAADLPSAGRRVRLRLVARRFRCEAAGCRRRIFVERFGPGIVETYARRTARLDCLVHHLGLALGGRPAESFARRLMVPVSKDTLLRAVRRHARPYADPLEVIGIDDWAVRRNHRYGTIVCDLARRRVVALLPDREAGTVEAWLKAHSDIRVIARDRGGGYGEASARALPDAVQVADRWHLMENASAALLDSVRRSMREVRTALGAATIDPALLTAAERLQYEGFQRREDATREILAFAAEGLSIKAIVKRTGRSRKLVRHAIRGERTDDVFRTRQNSLQPYLPMLDGLWSSGCRNGAELWRRLRTRGFTGSLRVVAEWATRRRRAKLTPEALHRPPSARTIARMMTTARDHLTPSETLTVAAVEAAVPKLAAARDLIDRFQAMIRGMADADLDGWIAAARSSLLASFAAGINRDLAAVRAAIATPWSNGQTEGQITRLKLIKRQMYGRAKIDLLQARLVGIAAPS
jgi:transposase